MFKTLLSGIFLSLSCYYCFPITFDGLTPENGWNVKYPFTVCHDNEWEKEIVIDITILSSFSDDSHLIIGIGTTIQYFAMIIALDGTVTIDSINGGVFLTPVAGNDLWEAITTFVCY